MERQEKVAAVTSSGDASTRIAKLHSNKKHKPPHQHQQKQQQHSHPRRNHNLSGEKTHSSNGQHNRKPYSVKKSTKKPSPFENEPYIVVITNVENDFSRIHQDALLRYCCLNDTHCSHAVSNGNAKEDRHQCHYTVTPRVETRSVEVSVYGKADADVSTIFQPVRTSAKPKTETKKNPTKNTKGECEVVESVGKSHATPTTLFATIDDMALALCHKPYFTHPPQFLLHQSSGPINTTSLGTKRERENDTESHENHNNDDTNGTSMGHKRAKKEETSEEKKDENVNPNKAETEAQDSKKSTTKDTVRHVKHRRHGDVDRVRRVSSRQADMVTATAVTSARMSTKDICMQLQSIPGFITGWLLYPQHYRVVFETKTALFKAKQLLDQFEMDGHVRVALTLADALTREFTDFVVAEEAVA